MSVKECLQQAFETWGLPQAIRVDNGVPWGTNSPVPSALALWLAGLGVEMIYGRPAQSTDNAIVERCHRVLGDWAEPEKQSNITQLQANLDWAVRTQRERYRSSKHLTRAQAYPDLYTNRLTYRRSTDAQRWQQSLMLQYLSRYTFERRVGKYGQLSLFSNTYSLGRSHARQTVTIELDPLTAEWLFLDEQGFEIRRQKSKEADYERISLLQLGKRRKTT